MNKRRTRLGKKLWLWLALVLAMLLALLLVVLHSLPGLGLLAASRWYAQQGEGYALSAQNWQFAPFKTRLELHGVELQHPGVGADSTQLKRLVLQFRLRELFNRRLLVEQVQVDGLHGQLVVQEQADGQHLQLAGLSFPLVAAPMSDREPLSEQAADEPAVAHADDAAPGTEPVQDSGPESGTEPWRFALNQLQLNDVQWQWDIALAGLRTQGQLNLQTFQLSQFDSLGEQPVRAELTLQLARLAVQQPAITAGNTGDFSDTLVLQQPLQLQLNGRIHDLQTQPRWEGEAGLYDLQLDMPGLVRLSLAELLLAGINADAVQQQLHSLQLNGMLIEDNSGRNPAVQLEQLHLQELSNDGRLQAVQQLQLQGLRVGDAEQPLLLLQHYQLQDIQWQSLAGAEAAQKGQRLSVGAQQYYGLELALRRAADGQILGLAAAAPEAVTAEQTADAVAAEPAPAAEEAPGTAATASPAQAVLTLLLAGLSQAVPDHDDASAADSAENSAESSAADRAESAVTSGSTLIIEDRSVNPPLQTTLALHELQVGAVNSQLDAQGFNLHSSVPLHLLLGLDRFNRITLDAELGLFQRDNQLYPQGPLQVTVRQLDLVPFNGYLAEALGYHVDRGTLDVDANIRIDKAQLQGEIKLLLRNSRFVPVDEATIDRVSKQIAMPVETALDLLRDDNGNIRLTIPVSGDLTDPDVGLGDITRQLSRLALQQGALFYLRQSLQPYSTMLSIASYAGDYLFAIRLDSLSFADHSSAITDEHQQHLQKLIGVMRDKKNLEVQACPFVNAAEAAALGENWPQLARARGDNLKAAVAALDAPLADRISVCRPQQGKRAEVMLGVN
ncbi:DUF748 domain-containing protein [Oceanospirillaceae bacterium ASx5O]|nr:DUF748 domain-containing protein [Oceanospirillaceae bacterium ASx5O]